MDGFDGRFVTPTDYILGVTHEMSGSGSSVPLPK